MIIKHCINNKKMTFLVIANFMMITKNHPINQLVIKSFPLISFSNRQALMWSNRLYHQFKSNSTWVTIAFLVFVTLLRIYIDYLKTYQTVVKLKIKLFFNFETCNRFLKMNIKPSSSWRCTKAIPIISHKWLCVIAITPPSMICT